MRGPLQVPRRGICVESLVDMISLISVHFIIYNNKRGVRYISPLSVINQVSLSRGSKSKQSKHSEEKYFQDSKTFPVEKSDFQLD